MLKKSFFLLLPLLFFLFSLGKTFAFDRPHFISFVNPVRGEEGWNSQTQSPIDLPNLQYQLSTPSAYPSNWLLRYDAVKSATISAFFKTLTATASGQTLGAFLEITPNLTAAAQVAYPAGEYWSVANRVFLSGYSQANRIKLIDAYMQLFFATFGYYPKVVGAWHIDSYSLAYLQEHYSVSTAVVCDEQYTTDNYRFWGGYLGSPYFPSKLNFLVPATTRDNRINIALTKWAARDPFNFYGERSESAFSFQVNDYLAVGQDTSYFAALVAIYSQDGFNEFTQVNIGLENDYDINLYRHEVQKTYTLLKQIQEKNNLVFISLPDFGTWLANRYTFTNPAFFYQTADITGKQPGRVYWYQNPFYRIGLKSQGDKTWLLDLRVYNQKEAEEHYLVENIKKQLFAEINPLVDSVKYPGSAREFPLDLSKAKITTSNWKVTFREGDKELKLEPEKITFFNFAPPVIDSEELKITTKGGQTIWTFSPRLPYTTTLWATIFIFLATVVTALVLIRFTKNPKSRLLLLAGWSIGSLSLITVVRSGLVFPFGLGFWGPNGHDALFHLSLGEHFKNSLLSLAHPQLSGQNLSNYHFGFDWLTGFLARLSATPLLDLYFRLIPVLMVMLLVFVTLRLLTLWRYPRLTILLALGLMFLAGSAGFIPSLIFAKGLFGGESYFWSNQSISLLLNPPFALSLLVLLLFLLLLEKRPHRLTPIDWLALSALGGLLVQIKIYAFILLFLALLLRRKVRLAIGVGLFGLVFILPSLGGVKGFPFVLQPLWFAKSMFESPDRLYWQKFAQAWQVYENNGVFGKLIFVNLIALVIFYLGNLWVRLIGLWPLIRGRGLTLSAQIAASIVILGLIIPLVFTQKANPWNTIQFLYYSLFFLSFYTAGEIGHWLSRAKHKTLAVLAVAFILLLSLPTTIGTLSDYTTSQSASRVTLTELRALDLLRRLPRGIVAAPLTYSRRLPLIPDPKPLYVYASTAYISALSGQPEYLSDTINLDITGFDYKERVKNILRLYQTRDPLWVKKFFDANQISYIYETPYDKLRVRKEDTCLIKIFDSGEINLYKYSCHD